MKHKYKFLIYCIAILSVLIQFQSFAQSKNGAITGTVKTSDGKPASEVTVLVKGTGHITMTSEKGVFLIKGVNPGSYTLKISFAGLQTQEIPVVVTAGKTTTGDYLLTENLTKLQEVQVTANKSANQKATTVGKSGIAAKDMPQSIQIIGSEVITDQQVNRLSDVIKNVNGIALGESRGSTTESFFARGYSLGSNNILKNGVRSSSGGLPEASTLESVEILKGSAALLYGGVTGGAVVNLVTKKPKFDFGGELSLRTGSYGLIKPIGDIYGPITKKLAFRVIATKENADSYRDHVQADRLYINPSLLYNIGKNTELIVQGDYLKSDYTPDFGIGTVGNKIVNIGRNAYLNTVWAYNNTNTTNTQANLTHKFNDSWKLNAIVAYQGYDRNYFSAERPAADTLGVASRNLTRSKTKEITYNQQINLTGSFKTGFIKHQFLFGADADESKTTSYGFEYPDGKTTYLYDKINLLDPSTYNVRTDLPGTTIISNTVSDVYRMGTFLQDLIILNDKFKVLAGIRYTFQKTPRTSTYNEKTGVSTLSDNSLNKSKIEGAFSPKFGLIYQPIKSTSIYASYANNFTSNTGTDVYLKALDPSIINQYEAGIKNDFWDGKMSVNVTWYKILNNNFAQMAQFQADGVTPNSVSTIKEFSGSTASEGIELDVTGKLAKGLNFLAGYSYSYYRYTKTLDGGITEGERVIGTTPHTANGTIFYTFSTGKVKGLKLGASSFYTGERNSGFNTLKPPKVARGIPIIVSAYTTVDLSAGYTYKKLSLLAKLSNITNEINYLVHENYSVNPIPPRMFITTLAYKF